MKRVIAIIAALVVIAAVAYGVVSHNNKAAESQPATEMQTETESETELLAAETEAETEELLVSETEVTTEAPDVIPAEDIPTIEVVEDDTVVLDGDDDELAVAGF